MTDLSVMKLGKQAKVFDPRVRAITPISHTWPTAPRALDWTTKRDPNIGMMLNDRLGNCTIASKGHIIQTWTSLTRPAEATVSDPDVLAAYEGACGFNPSDPNTDQGGVMTKVASWWLNNSIGGHKISAMASVSPGSQTDVTACIWIFGHIDIGVQLPISAQNQDVWDVPPGGPRGSGEPGSWGGHDIAISAYDLDRGTNGMFKCDTWGGQKWLTLAFLLTYADEGYVYLSPDWLAANDLAPPNFKLQQLEDYLNEFR